MKKLGILTFIFCLLLSTLMVFAGDAEGSTLRITASANTFEGHTYKLGFKVRGEADSDPEVCFRNTNTETVNIKGVKTWNDENDKDGIRPSSITVGLIADGETIDSKTVTEKDGWKYEFKNLPKYINGKEVKYEIDEKKVNGYETEIKGCDITNTHKPEGKTVPSIKTRANLKVGEIKDSVELSGLAKGIEYTVTGELMVKETGEEVAKYKTEPVTFTAEDVDKTLNVDFSDIDASELGGKHIVVFETLTWRDNSVSHADLNDEDQTVFVEKRKYPQTGDGASIAGLMVALWAAGAASLHIKRKREE